MQGWRNTMEDSHISEFDVEPGVHVFGVFDGHGGNEVAEYVRDYFVESLKKNDSFQ